MKIRYSRHFHLNAMIELGLETFARSGIVLVTGPSGSGKTNLAEYLFEHSPFASGGAFVSQQAASFQEHRFESQLFGHASGAFSGATAFAGLLGMTGIGALCIEGLEDLALACQAKMLRFLQDRRYRPLGAVHERSYSGGLIFTSRLTLRQLMDSGVMREDFLFRLGSQEVALPPVSERIEDFSAVGRALLEELLPAFPTATFHWLNEDFLDGVSPRMKGNFHELRNLLQRALITGESPRVLAEAERALPEVPNDGILPDTGSLKSDLRVIERQLLKRALCQFPDSRRELARSLGISSRALQYKLREHHLLDPVWLEEET